MGGDGGSIPGRADLVKQKKKPQKPDAARVAEFREKLAHLPGKKVGICWRSMMLGAKRAKYFSPIDGWAPLLKTPGVSFVNLQHGDAARGLGPPDLTQWMTNYAETAALIGTLDLIITVDTSVAHLAGALGKPVWLLLAHAPDWRWLLGRTDSPWYPSVRLFRQEAPGDWDGVLDTVRRELCQSVQTLTYPSLRRV